MLKVGNPGGRIFVNYTDKKNEQANDLTKVLFLIKVKFNSNFNLTNSEYKIAIYRKIFKQILIYQLKKLYGKNGMIQIYHLKKEI